MSSHVTRWARWARWARRAGVLLLLGVPPAGVPQTPGSSPAPEAAPLPDAATLYRSIEPTVRIMEEQRGTIEEYGVGNNVYMIKVTPKGFPPYYLIDPDGSGEYEWRRGETFREMRVPQWSLFRW